MDGSTLFEDNMTITVPPHSQLNYCDVKPTSNTHKVTYIVEAYISPSIFILGIITNVITFHILRRMSLGKVCKLLLSALCMTDLLASLVGLISNLMEIIIFHGEMPFGRFCPGVVETYTTYFLFMMLLAMSHTIVIVISAMRVYAMWKPFESRNLSKRRAIKLLIIMYTLVFLLFLPVSLYIMWQSCFDDKDTVPVCKTLYKIFPNISVSKIYILFLSFIFAPCIVIINLISLVFLHKTMKKSSAESLTLQYTSEGEHHSGSQMRKSKRITRVLFYVLIVNTVCIVPLCIQSAMLLFDSKNLVFHKSNLIWALYDVIAETMLQVIPCYNFWTYLLINKDFRRKFKQIYLCQEKEEGSSDMTYRTSESRSKSNLSLTERTNINRQINAKANSGC